MLITVLAVFLQAMETISALQFTPAAPVAQPSVIRWEPWSLQVDGRTIQGELGRLAVPRDHTNPADGSVELAFVRLPATVASPGQQSATAASPIIYLAGGPGDSGIGNLRVSSMRALFDTLRTSGDLILLDQRGVGLSTPNLACPRALPPTNLFASEATFRDSFRTGMALCADTMRARGISARHYTTSQSAADVNAVRRALGAERMRLVGFSYGTHLGLAVIRAFGTSVERAVLAGVEGPDDNEKLPMTFDANLERLAAAAKLDPAVSALANDLAATFDSALARLDREPARIRIPHPLQRGDSVTLTIGSWGFRHVVARDLGDSNDWPLLPGLIVRTSQGDFGLLTAFARRRWGPLPSFMSAAMDCASGSSAQRARDVAAQRARSRFGTSMIFYDRALCTAIDAADLGASYRTAISSDVPTLFVSGSLDNQTPPEQAERVKRGFARGAHLVVDNAGHESTLNVPAVMSAIDRFMRGATVGDSTITVPMPRFRGPGA